MLGLWEKWRLSKQESDSVELIPRMKKPIRAKIIEVYDGDTCKVVYRFGRKYFKISIRIGGIDTPEIRGGSQNETKAAEQIRDHVRELILGKIKYIYIEKWDKYGGRVVGDVFLNGKNKPLSGYLLQRGLAKKYDGSKKEEWTDAQCKNILKKI